MAEKHDLQESGSGIPVLTNPLDLSTTALEIDAIARAENLIRAERSGELESPRSGVRQVMFNSNADERRYSIRSYIPDTEGSGFWDIYKVGPDVMVMIGECQYNTNKWLAVPGEHAFKIRYLDCGLLLDETEDVFLDSPRAMFELYPGERGDGYFVQANNPCRVVVVHCTNEVLSSRLGIVPSSAPMPIRLLDHSEDDEPYKKRFQPTAAIERAFKDILDSRDLLEPNLRAWFVESKAKEVITLLVQSILQEPDIRVGANIINRRDRQRILEAKEIILARIDDVPPIPDLARMVGTNQTKLKVGFKEIVGMTIGNFITERKMELAAKMLTSTDLVISQISQSLGYGHSGNFTQAFKRYYGRVPREYRRVVDVTARPQV